MTIYRDDLERVYALIERPERWTQGEYARDASGEPVAANSEQAVCWCLYGAADRLCLEDRSFFKAVAKPRMDMRSDLSAFNDERDHEEVLALLRQAIERAPVRPSSPTASEVGL